MRSTVVVSRGLELANTVLSDEVEPLRMHTLGAVHWVSIQLLLPHYQIENNKLPGNSHAPSVGVFN